jgi:hypothetical protein
MNKIIEWEMNNKSIRYLLLLSVLIVAIGLYLIEMDMREWRSDDLRPHYEYTVQTSGLSGKETSGITYIAVPIPATKKGTFAIAPSQKDPSIFKRFLQDNVFHTPNKYKRGIHFENTTEALDDKSIDGNWSTSIIDTAHGKTLLLQTNSTVLHDIYFSKLVVLEEVNEKELFHQGNPILFPVENITEEKNLEIDDQHIKIQEYDSYVNASENINNSNGTLIVRLDVYPDVSDRVGNVGTYQNQLETPLEHLSEWKTKVIVTHNQ